MYLRDLVKFQFTQAGLYSRKDAHLQSFLKYIDDTPMECWDDYVALFRREYYDLFDDVIPPLLRSADKLLRINLFRRADASQPKELSAIRAFIGQADPVADRPELISIWNRSAAAVKDDFLKRPALKEIFEPAPVLQRKTTNVPRQESVSVPAPPSKERANAPQ